jgi:HSP20 family molecular chaperone IbpA
LIDLVLWKPLDRLWDPFFEIEHLQERMNSLFSSSLARFPEKKGQAMFKGRCSGEDIHDFKDKVMVKAVIPGMEKKDFDISVHGNTPVINGEKIACIRMAY